MQFEPFQDRLSRIIRNELSTAMHKGLVDHEFSLVQQVANSYLQKDIDMCYREYIQDRLGRYSSVLEKVQRGPDDVLWQALVLWDHKLFFEVHEVLEHAWVNATGEEKDILQAMIRAAGVYIKLEHGYTEAARKMAGRSLPVLKKHRKFLGRYFDPEKLLQALQKGEATPPRLLS